VWIENLNSWIFEPILKYNNNILTKKYYFIKMSSQSQYCMEKCFVWRGPWENLSNKATPLKFVYSLVFCTCLTSTRTSFGLFVPLLPLVGKQFLMRWRRSFHQGIPLEQPTEVETPKSSWMVILPTPVTDCSSTMRKLVTSRSPKSAENYVTK